MKCQGMLKKVHVSVHGARQKVLSYQCQQCDYFEFESASSRKVVEELREVPLKKSIAKLFQDILEE